MIYNLPRKKSREETWVLKSTFSSRNSLPVTKIAFISNGEAFSSIVFKKSAVPKLYYDSLQVAGGFEAMGGGYDMIFKDNNYRTVTFFEPPTGDLLTWLQANAVKQ